jgi:hypothetical protein
MSGFLIQKSQELHKIQKAQIRDWETWKNQIEETHLQEIQTKKTERFKNAQIWKKDILQKREDLKMLSTTQVSTKSLEQNLSKISERKKKKLKELNKNQLTLRLKLEKEYKMNLATLSGEKKKKSQALKKQYETPLIENWLLQIALSNHLEYYTMIYQEQQQMSLNSIQILKIEKLNDLKQKTEILNTKYSLSLTEKLCLKNQKSKELEKKKEILKNQLEKNLIEKLKIMPEDFPKNLQVYWKHKEWDTISKSLNSLKIDISLHENYLTRKLGIKNKTLDWLMTTYKDEIEKMHL